MPPTMILIGVCARAGAMRRGEAASAARRAAARSLRMGVSLGWVLEVLGCLSVWQGRRFQRGGFLPPFGGHEDSGDRPSQPGIWECLYLALVRRPRELRGRRRLSSTCHLPSTPRRLLHFFDEQVQPQVPNACAYTPHRSIPCSPLTPGESRASVRSLTEGRPHGL